MEFVAVEEREKLDPGIKSQIAGGRDLEGGEASEYLFIGELFVSI